MHPIAHFPVHPLHSRYAGSVPSAPSAKVLLATYAEVKAMLPSHKSLQTATNAVQECLNDIKIWAAKWDTAINC
uniref:HDC11637 n=1 Tax=Drosophila melanogaster TaxID=7227 RepID=Q6IKR7_DROME|nr:TPA_inf: HDC11637 [Drosophila melanogaster]